MIVFSSSSGEWNRTSESSFLQSNTKDAICSILLNNEWQKKVQTDQGGRKWALGFVVLYFVQFLSADFCVFFNTAVTELNLLVLFFPILQIWKVWRWTIHSNLCRKIVDKPDLRHQETETLYSEVLDLFVRRNSYPHRNVVRSLIPSALPGAEGLQSVGLWACPSAQLAVQRQRPWGQQIQILLLPTTRASGRA